MCAGLDSEVSWGSTGRRVVFLISVAWRMLLVNDRKHQRVASSNPSILGRRVGCISSPYSQHFLWTSPSYEVSACMNVIVASEA